MSLHRLPVVLFRMALRAHPRGIRERYEEEMVQVFRQALEARGTRGDGTTGFTVRCVADAVASGMRERVRRRRTKTGAGAKGPGDGTMTTWTDLRSDVRLALRTLRRTPGFTVAAILVLALGIGANAALFTAVKSVLVAPAPFPEPQELVLLDLADSSRVEGGPPRATAWSYPKYRILRDAEERLADPVAAFAVRNLPLTGAGDPVLLGVEVVTPDYLSVLRVPPALGRDFTEADDSPAAEPVALLSHGLWLERFGGDPGILGRSIRLAGLPVTVVGVAERGFRGVSGSGEVWVPVHTAAQLVNPMLVEGAETHWLRAVARLAPGASMPALQERMRAVGRRVVELHPGSDPNTVTVATAERLQEARVSPRARQALLFLLLGSLLVLATACANLAGLLVTRASTREEETAVRRALGAGRWRVARTFLTESLLLALAGGAVAVGVAHLGVEALTRMWPRGFLRGSWNVAAAGPDALTVDPVVLGYTFAVALAAGFLFGLVPAVVSTRGSAGMPSGHRGPGRTSGTSRMRGGLVAAEVALALVLVVGAGLLARSMAELGGVDRGFRDGPLLTFSTYLASGTTGSQDPSAFHEAALERLERLPGVESGAVTCAVPLGGHCWIGGVRRAGSDRWEMGSMPSVGINQVSDDFFATLGVPVLEGRTFGPQDRADSPPVVVLSQSAATRLFPDGDALGRPVSLTASLTPEGGATAEVVGIVGDVLYDPPEVGTMPEAYLSHRQEEGAGAYLLRTTREPLTVLPEIRREMTALAPDLPLYRMVSLQDLERTAASDTRLLGALLAAFALLSLVLAATGIWAVVAYGVSRRSRELGLRMALGARGNEVVGMVVRDQLGIVGMGLAAGGVAAWFGAGLLEGLLFGVVPTDPLTFLGGVILLLTAGLAAAWLPARRAARLQPLDALRSD